MDLQSPLFIVLDLERLVPTDHPLRPIKRRADELLRAMSRDFNAAYSQMGRPSIPPEQLLKALLLQALFSLRSEIALMESLRFNLLYRWFVDLPVDAEVWTPESFSTNRERFAAHQLLRKFFDRVVASALTQQLAGSEHFSVDGTLIRSWASAKSLHPIEASDAPMPPPEDRGNPSVDFHGEKRRNDTHRSTSDPEARLARKSDGKEAHLSYAVTCSWITATAYVWPSAWTVPTDKQSDATPTNSCVTCIAATNSNRAPSAWTRATTTANFWPLSKPKGSFLTFPSDAVGSLPKTVQAKPDAVHGVGNARRAIA